MFIGSLWDHMGSFQQIGWPLNWANLQRIWRQASGYRRIALDVTTYLKDAMARQVESWKECTWFHHLMKFPWRVKVSCFSRFFGPKMRNPIATDVLLGMFAASITYRIFPYDSWWPIFAWQVLWNLHIDISHDVWGEEMLRIVDPNLPPLIPKEQGYICGCCIHV